MIGADARAKTDSHPMEIKPTVALDTLLLGFALDKRDETLSPPLPDAPPAGAWTEPPPARQKIERAA